MARAGAVRDRFPGIGLLEAAVSADLEVVHGLEIIRRERVHFSEPGEDRIRIIKRELAQHVRLVLEDAFEVAGGVAGVGGGA